jgi:hypothetical protein
MANLTSSQSGNWTSSSTWGGSTPADGDTFTISQGHKVTVNSDQRAGTGFGDISVRGNLHFATNGKIRINGRITVQGNGSTDYSKTDGVSAQDFTEGGSSSGALLSATGNNIRLEFEGNNDDQHGIWIENVTYSSWKFIGDDNVTITNTASAVAVEDTYVHVASTTGFAIGDWISIYHSTDQDYRVRGDEGAWIHDIDTSNKRIYIRKFVGPKAIVSSASGTSLVVDYTKIFRVGYKIIFGTGSNRNVKEITAINHNTKTLTLDSSISGTISSGTEVFETGFDKIHHSGGCHVRQNATTLTSAAAVNDTTVTIGNSNNFDVGDYINIDVNNDTDTNWDYNSSYEITGKSGNTLTVSPAIGHVRKVGSLVQKLTRPIQIYGVDTDVRAYCYVEYWTNYNQASTREIVLKNVEWKQMGGNTNNTYYRASCFTAGYNSRYRENDYATDSRYDCQSRYENNVCWNNNNPGQSYTGLNTRHPHSFVHRNSVLVNNGWASSWLWSSHMDMQFVNNYGTRNHYTNFYTEGLYDMACEVAYNYCSRSDDYAWFFHHNRDITPIHNNIVLNSENRPLYHYYSPPGQNFRRWFFEGFRTMIYNGVGSGQIKFIDSYFNPKWYKEIPEIYSGYTTNTGAVDAFDYSYGNGGPEGRNTWERGGAHWQNVQFIDFNFEEGTEALLEGGHLIFRKNGETNWTIANGRTEYYPLGKIVTYIPPNTAVTVKGEFRGPASSSGWSYPYLVAYTNNNNGHGRYTSTYTGETSYLDSSDAKVVNSNFYCFRQQVRFDSGSLGAWQEKSLSIAAQKYGYELIAFYAPDSDEQEEGPMYVRDIRVVFTGARPKTKILDSRAKVQSTVSRKRISGRI